MITYIRGTEKAGNSAARNAALLASLCSFSYGQKVLVLQINDRAKDVEYYLTGKQDNDDDDFEINIDERGIDSLLLRAENGRVVEEQFDSLVDPIRIDKNALDIAPQTLTGSIEENILSKKNAFANLLKCAAGKGTNNTPYDNVIVVVDGKNTKYLEEILQFADIEIVCVGQTVAEFDNKIYLEKKKEVQKKKDKKIPERYILVNGYEEESRFTVDVLKKSYETKNVYYIPRNVLYNDAAATGTILKFVEDNKDCDEHDVNYHFFEKTKKFLDKIYKGYDFDENKAFKNLKHLGIEEEDPVENDFLPEGAIGIEEYDVKKSVFSKVTKEKQFVINDESTSSGEEIFFVDMGVSESYKEAVEEKEKEQLKPKRRGLFGKKEDDGLVEPDNSFDKALEKKELQAKNRAEKEKAAKEKAQKRAEEKAKIRAEIKEEKERKKAEALRKKEEKEKARQYEIEKKNEDAMVKKIAKIRGISEEQVRKEMELSNGASENVDYGSEKTDSITENPNETDSAEKEKGKKNMFFGLFGKKKAQAVVSPEEEYEDEEVLEEESEEYQDEYKYNDGESGSESFDEEDVEENEYVEDKYEEDEYEEDEYKEDIEEDKTLNAIADDVKDIINEEENYEVNEDDPSSLESENNDEYYDDDNTPDNITDVKSEEIKEKNDISIIQISDMTVKDKAAQNMLVQLLD